MKLHRIALAATAALCCLLLAGRAQAAQNMYLEISGVPGEVTTPAAYVNHIQVLAASWGGSRPCPSGASNFQDLSMTKYVDKASTLLLTAMKNGTVYPTATLRFIGPHGQVYTSYQLTNAAVTSVSTGGSGGEDRNTENVTMTFSQMTVTYTFVDSVGKVGASSSTTIVGGSCP